MKSKILFSIAFVFALCISLFAFPENKGLVTDEANVFSPQEHTILENKLRTFEEKTSIEFAVVTVNSLDGKDIDQYRNELFKAWGIGKKGKDNGVLMVVAPNEPPRGKIGIEVGYGLEGALNDSAVGEIVRHYVVPGWRSSHRADGLIAGVDAIVSRLQAAPPEQATTKATPARQEEATSINPLIIGIGIIGLLAGVAFAVWKHKKHVEELEARRLRAEEAWQARKEELRKQNTIRHTPPVTPVSKGRTYVPVPIPIPEPRRRSYSDDSPSYGSSSSSSYDSGSSGGSSSSSYDFGGGSSGGGGFSGDL